MQTFTLIGYWPESLQRFSTFIEAHEAADAEIICLRKYPGVAICGVLKGRHQCVDTVEHVFDLEPEVLQD